MLYMEVLPIKYFALLSDQVGMSTIVTKCIHRSNNKLAGVTDLADAFVLNLIYSTTLTRRSFNNTWQSNKLI